jgi:GNAT superfamily N-acetyltransferase
MIVRRAQLTDLDQMRLLYRTWRHQQPAYPRLDAEEEERFVAAWREQFCDTTGYHAAWVALDHGRIVGFMDADIRGRAFGKPRWYIHGSSLWVEPASRHLGAAVRLLAAAYAWAARSGLPVVEMSEVPETQGAWGKRGWAQQKVNTSYWADLGMLRRSLGQDFFGTLRVA